MAGITGRGTTFSLPNYHGRLLSVSPTDTPFTTVIGGLTGGQEASQPEFEWQGYDLRAADQATRVRLEGADAPTAEERVRFNVSNVAQIHQEAVDVSYTKLAAVSTYAGVNAGRDDNPVANEVMWQLDRQLEQIKRDVEYSFVQGVYQKPADNTTPRKTRGLTNAITTNVSSNGGVARPLDETIVLDLLQDCWDNGGIQVSDTATIMVNSFQKRQLTKIFITDKNVQPRDRNVGGVNLMTIETDFGRLNIMLNRYVPADQLIVASLDVCVPRFVLIPEKGFLFAEPLAKTGASEKVQIYGEIGLEYGLEKQHALAKDLATS